MRKKIISLILIVSVMLPGNAGIAAAEESVDLTYVQAKEWEEVSGMTETVDGKSTDVPLILEETETNSDSVTERETEGISKPSEKEAESEKVSIEAEEKEADGTFIESVEVLADEEYVSKQIAEGEVAIDAAHFPDEAFRTKVGSYDENKDGVLSAEEIKNVRYLSIYSEDEVRNLKGIEYFTSLTSLSCRDCELNSLDVSQNAALESLSCDNNQLKSLDVSQNAALWSLSCMSNQLSGLDVSHNTDLILLSCSHNQLSSLNVGQNVALKSLWCGYNQLKSLDVSQNVALESLSCDNNQLSSLDVSSNSALKSLDCNNNQLSSLDLNYGQVLEELNCRINQLSSLDISHNTALKSLDCYDNQLKSLDISHNVALESLSCNGNQLNSLDISSNVALKRLECSDNQLKSLNISHNVALESLSCNENQLSSLDASQNPVLSFLGCVNNELHIAAPTKVNGVWQLNLADIIGSSNLERVTIGTTGALLTNGIVSFTGNDMPKSLWYKYDPMGPAVSNGNPFLNVTLKWDMSETPSGGGNTENPDGGSTTKPECKEHDMETVVDRKATCGTPGLQHRECRICGYKEESTEIPATGIHSFGAYVTTKEPTTEEKGIRTRTCTVCGKTESVSIPKIVKKNQKITVKKKITKTYEKYGTFDLGASAEGNLSYKTSNKKVAMVYSWGLVEMKGPGTAVITVKAAATSEYKAATRKVTLVVKGKQKQTISVNKTLQKNYGDTFNLGARAKGKLTYKVSDKRVAVVSSAGTVKITGCGTATITVKAAATEKYEAATETVQLTAGPGGVQLTSVTSEEKGCLDLEWTKNSQVSGYEINVAADKSFSAYKRGIAKSSLTKTSVPGLTAGRTYFVRIRGYRIVSGNQIYGPWSAVKYCKVSSITLPKVQLISVISPRKGFMRIKWGKNSQVTGYQLQCSTQKEFGTPNSINIENKNLEEIDTPIDSGRRYYVRIQGYVSVNGTNVYGPWSAVKDCIVQ